MTSSYDTVVVGAGVTGLMTAYRLTQAGQRVLVLEARDRVGGRLRTESHHDSDFEIGGQWVSPDQTALIGLLEELGLETYARYREGDSLYVDRAGAALRFAGEDLPLEERTAKEIDRLIGVLDELAADMDPDRPWNHPRAEELDHVTFGQWLEQQCDDPEARDNVALYIGPAMLTKPVWSFSALQAVLMAASAGSFTHLVDADFILDRRVIGGLASVPAALADRLGDRVRLGADVERIEWDPTAPDAGADVQVGGERIHADRVVLALPPTHVQRIRIAPELPAEHRHAREHQSFGLVIKVQVEYATPFWRQHGLSGTGFGPYQLVHEVYDNTLHDATKGTLVGFVSDVRADEVGRLDAGERQERILASLAAYFGEEALHPITYVESDWQHQELTGGAYATSFDVGGLTRYGARLHEPVGPLEFGSSDIAGLGFQHVDGAVRMGERLAARVLGDPTAV
ncbi:flavin monoamine oxidase family protein [Nocardioides sp. Kera G14]|uniref:flavin monoamine oxidase family protein n=1 Tax=Nocardioides sp. Kera G14 TaxID=2884264 RepID=UPI001D10F567|nr:NAD(P)/FAD-dependent oxidoreductase [Nocardioides sp. Kera G14]UDY23296.1 FAD-dependent oxidoreductase [Nocardioides sp. Kera G14]